MFNVQVLQRWDELGDAILYLSERGHRFHRNPLKNWDLRLIEELSEGIDRGGAVADLGASTLGAVRLFYELGFNKIHGYDLTISRFDRMIQLRDWIGAARRQKRLLLRPPYTLASRDLLHTGIASGSLDVLSCLSVIEHGVDLASFFAEAARMLRPGGRLYVSTDYWEPKLDTSQRRMYGLPWTVFDAEELTVIAGLALTHGLQTTTPDPTELQVGVPIVRDRDLEYTFAAMRFEKVV